MTELRIICDGGRIPHRVTELAVVEWHPMDLDETGAAVWDVATRPKTLVMTVKGDGTAHSGRSDRPKRIVHRTANIITTRKDGGQTVHVPACHRCGTPARAIRDNVLREYVETLCDTPNAVKTLNMALM